jgi:hypothetical protein
LETGYLPAYVIHLFHGANREVTKKVWSKSAKGIKRKQKTVCPQGIRTERVLPFSDSF